MQLKTTEIACIALFLKAKAKKLNENFAVNQKVSTFATRKVGRMSINVGQSKENHPKITQQQTPETLHA